MPYIMARAEVIPLHRFHAYKNASTYAYTQDIIQLHAFRSRAEMISLHRYHIVRNSAHAHAYNAACMRMLSLT